MRNVILIGLVALWAGFTSVSLAQVSTFPNPPPLTTGPGSDQSTNNTPLFPSPPPLASSSNQNSDSSTNNASGTSGMPPQGTPGGGAEIGPIPPSLSPTNTTPPANPTDNTPVTASTLNSMSALDDKIPLEAGDRISFRVIEDRDDAVSRIVTDTGEVDFPYVGRLKAAGLTCRQIAQQLKKLLEVDYYKRATVIVGLDVIVAHAPAEATHDMAWIVGQVHQVGPQELSKVQPVTVSQIILRAGGFGDFADERKVRIVHRKPTSSSPAGTTVESQDANSDSEGEVVDVKSVLEGHSTIDPIVKPNDLIIVPKKFINF